MLSYQSTVVPPFGTTYSKTDRPNSFRKTKIQTQALSSPLLLFNPGKFHIRAEREREFFIDILLVRVYLIIEIIIVDRPYAMEV